MQMTGPFAVVLMSRLNEPSGSGLPTSRENPLVIRAPAPFPAAGAMILNPNACLGIPKFPVPGPTCVHRTAVPPSRISAVQFKLIGLSSGGSVKSVDDGPNADVMPHNPLSVMVVTGWKIE